MAEEDNNVNKPSIVKLKLPQLIFSSKPIDLAMVLLKQAGKFEANAQVQKTTLPKEKHR